MRLTISSNRQPFYGITERVIYIEVTLCRWQFPVTDSAFLCAHAHSSTHTNARTSNDLYLICILFKSNSLVITNQFWDWNWLSGCSSDVINPEPRDPLTYRHHLQVTIVERRCWRFRYCWWAALVCEQELNTLCLSNKQNIYRGSSPRTWTGRRGGELPHIYQ